MDSFFRIEGNRLIREYDGEKTWIEPWGENSLRFRCTKESEMPENRDWALLEQASCKVDIKLNGKQATITNGKITCCINEHGVVKYINEKNQILFSERWQDRNVKGNPSALLILWNGSASRTIFKSKRLRIRAGAAEFSG